MRIKNINTGNTFDIEPMKDGENHMRCPECSKNRTHPEKKSFSWNSDKQTGYCHHCQSKFVPDKALTQKKEYSVPEWKNITNLTDKAVKYFESRKISQGTLKYMQVYSDNEFMPQLSKEVEVICFPYFVNGKLVNIKYRGVNKSFKLFKDAELVLYNFDCIKQSNEIIITEGEIDALSFIECGLKNVVSVPNGASNKCEYLDAYYEYFEGKRIIIAVDNDLPGLNLKNELLRRFGAENCQLVNFKECKDANEYLVAHGGFELMNVYNERYDAPVSGIIDLNKIYDDIYGIYINGLQPGIKINDELDNIVTWESKRVAVVTGIPSHGKSEFVDWLCSKINSIHGWKTAYFSPENFPISYHYAKLAAKKTGVSFNSTYLSIDKFNETFEYIKDNFFFIYPDDNFSLDTVLEKAKYLVRRNGVKTIVIDPYNKLEHNHNVENETTYISKFLDKLTTFAQRNDVLIIIVAHPTKIKKNKDGTAYEVPTLYDINGSANWYNKCDYGIVFYRVWGDDPHVEIYVQKVKFLHLGSGGRVMKKYNKISGNLEPYSEIDSFLPQENDKIPF